MAGNQVPTLVRISATVSERDTVVVALMVVVEGVTMRGEEERRGQGKAAVPRTTETFALTAAAPSASGQAAISPLGTQHN